MKDAQFLTWLKDWLARHPLRAPSESMQASYTREVMERIKEEVAPAPVLRWIPRPRLALSFAAVAACFVVWIMVGPRAQTGAVVRHIDEDFEILALMEEPVDLPLDYEDLEEEIKSMDVLVITQAREAQSETSWILQMMELMDELEEESGPDGDDQTLDDWLREIEFLDQEDLASS